MKKLRKWHMPKLKHILETLIQGNHSRRLGGGLELAHRAKQKQHTLAGGRRIAWLSHTLEISRMDKPPSETELLVVFKALNEVIDPHPAVLTYPDKCVERSREGGGVDYVYRIKWSE